MEFGDELTAVESQLRYFNMLGSEQHVSCMAVYFFEDEPWDFEHYIKWIPREESELYIVYKNPVKEEDCEQQKFLVIKSDCLLILNSHLLWFC